MKVPFLDLGVQYESIHDEVKHALDAVMEKGAFAGGPFVEQFEKDFAPYCQCRFACGVGSGTEALWLVLMALGIGQGDEVITVPNTFIATVEAISLCGATPVFVDIDEQTFNMNAALLESAITPRTRAVIPVHLFGQMADMDAIMKVAKDHNLHVIEDACQAQGAEYKGRRSGSIGVAGCFSFYPGKNLGAYGEAGAIVTDDAALDRELRMLRDHGQSKKYYHKMIGWNARMDGMQGAVLSVKLSHLESWNEARRRHADLYNRLIDDFDHIIKPREAEYAKHVYHVYAIRVQSRDSLIEAMAQKNVHCGIHYPKPVHLQEAYDFLELKEGSYPTAEKCAKELVSLPMFPELSEKQIEYVVDGIGDFFSES